MIDSLDSAQTPAEDPNHLSDLRSLVQRVMADGKISRQEAQQLRSALFADGQLTPDELEVVRKTMRETLGDNPLEFD
jgi:uncharacterized tellurite resistance protein B-like protein